LIGKNSIVERVLEGHLSVILRRFFGSQGENRVIRRSGAR